jgi:hypothetical protein
MTIPDPWGEDFSKSTDEMLKPALVAWMDANPTISEDLLALMVEQVVQSIFFERTTAAVEGEAVEMSDKDRIPRLLAELEDLPPEEREAAIAALSDDDRAAVPGAELEATEAAEDDDELGGEA